MLVENKRLQYYLKVCTNRENIVKSLHNQINKLWNLNNMFVNVQIS